MQNALTKKLSKCTKKQLINHLIKFKVQCRMLHVVIKI